MTDLFENPMGLDGFEFVEFASPEPGILEPVFHVRRLRLKIEDHPDDPRLIVTSRGVGYRLMAG